jgi:hypothetical protein
MDISQELLSLPSETHSDYFNLPDFSSGGWTANQLQQFLNEAGFRHQPARRADRVQFDLDACPFCREREGNPAVWLWEGRPVFKCQRAKAGCSVKKFSDLQATLDRPPLACIKASDLVAKYCEPRRDVVLGLIRQGDVINVIGGPKTRKSFFVMQLALAVANGAPFVGRETIKGRVCVIDNELRGDDLARRLKAMATATGLSLEGIELLTLRGKLADLATIQKAVCGFSERYSLIIIDAFYKTLPKGTDENSNSDVTSLYVLLDETAEKTDSALAVVHHTSKGSQAGKSVTDMGSGAGAQSRSVDVHIVLRDHEDKDTVVLQAVIRAQPPIEPVCLTFRYPLWEVARDKNPERVAVANKRPAVTLTAFVETIPKEPAPKKQVLAATKTRLNVTQTELLALLQEAAKQHLVEIAEPKNPKLPHTIRRKENAA